MSPKHQLTVNVLGEPGLRLLEEQYKHRSLQCAYGDFWHQPDKRRRVRGATPEVITQQATNGKLRFKGVF